MKRSSMNLAAAVLAAAFGITGGAWAAEDAPALGAAKPGIVVPTDPRMAKAQKTANALRAATPAQRSSLYGSLAARGGSLAYAELPLTVALPALMDSDDMENNVELQLIKRDGDPVAVLYSTGDDEIQNDDDVIYQGYSLSTGAALTRTGGQISAGRSSYLLVETDGELQLSKLVAEANAQLRERFPHMPRGPGGLTTQTQQAPKAGAESKDWLWGVLHSIRADDFIKAAHGNANVYGVRIGWTFEGQPLVEVVQMPYFKNRYETYVPDQPLVEWGMRTNGTIDWSHAPWFSLLVMEHDSNHNFQELIDVIGDQVENITNEVGVPLVGTAAQAISAIVNALPKSWFIDDDDYLDVFYAIEYNEDFKGRGASNNIHIDMDEDEYTFNDSPAFVDLAAEKLVAGAGSYYPWQTLPAIMGVKNVGNLPSQGWSAKFYLTPANGVGAPVQIATGAGGALDPGEIYSKNLSLPLDGAGVAPGSYRLRVVVDAQGDDVPGNDTRYSAFSAPFTIKPAPGPGDLVWAKPDLKADYIVGVQGQYYATDEVQTWFGFDNNGGGSSDFDVHFWAVNQNSGLVSYLAKGHSGGIAAGQSYGGIVDVPLSGLVPGTYKLVMQIGSVQGESWTNNNIVPSLGTITVRQDLTGELGQ